MIPRNESLRRMNADDAGPLEGPETAKVGNVTDKTDFEAGFWLGPRLWAIPMVLSSLAGLSWLSGGGILTTVLLALAVALVGIFVLVESDGRAPRQVPVQAPWPPLTEPKVGAASPVSLAGVAALSPFADAISPRDPDAADRTKDRVAASSATGDTRSRPTPV